MRKSQNRLSIFTFLFCLNSSCFLGLNIYFVHESRIKFTLVDMGKHTNVATFVDTFFGAFSLNDKFYQSCIGQIHIYGNGCSNLYYTCTFVTYVYVYFVAFTYVGIICIIYIMYIHYTYISWLFECSVFHIHISYFFNIINPFNTFCIFLSF